MEKLIFLSGPMAGKSIELKGLALTVGKAHYNTIVLNDPAVSNEHCSFVKHRDGFWYIKELGSATGTLLNETTKVKGEIQLNPGDRVKVGASMIKIEISADYHYQGTPQPTPPEAEPPQAPRQVIDVPAVKEEDVDAYMKSLMKGGFKMARPSDREGPSGPLERGPSFIPKGVQHQIEEEKKIEAEEVKTEEKKEKKKKKLSYLTDKDRKILKAIKLKKKKGESLTIEEKKALKLIKVKKLKFLKQDKQKKEEEHD